jgi:SAM-dependent methyltransferase
MRSGIDSSDILGELETWYGRRGGQQLLAATRAAVQECLAMTFGYHVLQISALRGEPLYDSSPIHHRIYAAAAPGADVSLVCEGDELPFDSDSVDVAILHHGLEFTDQPHQVLREVQRVLTPHGHLVIVGFNPWSLLGINSRMRGFSGRSVWRHQRFLSEARLNDWLHLLGCAVESRRRIQTLPVFGGRRLGDWLTRGNAWCDGHNLPIGAVYITHAIKQVVGRNQPKRRLYAETRRRLIGLAVPQPSPVPSASPIAPTRRDGKGDDAA